MIRASELAQHRSGVRKTVGRVRAQRTVNRLDEMVRQIGPQVGKRALAPSHVRIVNLRDRVSDHWILAGHKMEQQHTDAVDVALY